MKNEKIMEFITAFENALSTRDKELYKTIYDGIKTGVFVPDDLKGCTDAARVLARFAGAVNAEMIDENAKAAGKTAIKKALEDVLKNAEARYNDEFKKAATAAGRQILIDGVRLYVLNGVTELSPERMTDDARTVERFEGLAEKFIPIYRKNENELNAPTLGRLKTDIKAAKAAAKTRGEKIKGVCYDFGANAPQVNAEYLLNALTVFGEKATLKAGAKWNDAIYIKSDAGEAILFPVAKNHDSQYAVIKA